MELLQKTKSAFDKFKESLLDAMQLLWEVHESKAWEQTGVYSFGQYVEDELQISQSMASKLLSNQRHYLVEGGVSQDKIRGIDHEKLYLAQKLSGSPQEQVEKARALTRAELKLEKNDDEEKPHAASFSEVCTICWVSKQNHS